ncbi:uncharacterized protein LOC111890456 [Lactuca sativa]|uniref:Beta-lactamase-related domain-containing protein n=1 Tax=Lactuca sativa TaxID=4236 RepID=A0A9R1X9H3_LACSA|nr:uncharacterized protein LOC111890456 [Lactuca sativa]KAJ0204396.1 hypothetical protein LSAT_V11C500250080 [Lactuca sativa]
MNKGTSTATKWLCETPIHSDVEAKLRDLLVELGNADKILGIQVCAYKDGKVIIDTAAGLMGADDPRPVQLDTLFPVFSATKGVTAGMIHWLADKGILKLDDNVANFWPEFAVNGKDQIKVHHILNHTSGLHNALADIIGDHVSLCNWKECVKRIAMASPETEPGCEQIYHYMSYGWLCGGIIEHASGKKFKDVLEEAFVRPLNLEGELYIGIPPGVESRLVTSAFDTSEFHTPPPPPPTDASSVDKQPYGAMPATLGPSVLPSLVNLTNMLDFRRALQPAGNGNFSARALARYYAALVDGGTTPSPHSSTTNSHTTTVTKIFKNPKSKIHDAFLATGDFKDFALPDGTFGLGFKRIKSAEGLVIGFGHAGLGGSTGYGDIDNRFSISVMINKMSFKGLATAEVIRFVCSELDLPVPEDYTRSREFVKKPLIN